MSIGRNQVRQVAEATVIQYANGKTQARPAGVGRFGPHVGFHIEVGKDEKLYRALHSLGTQVIEIRHQRPGGAEVVKHWDMGEAVRLFVITSGPVAPTAAGSLAGENARDTAEAGIGLRWADGERSKLAVRGFLDILGPEFLIQFAVRSRMTDELLKALVDHGRVCEAADGMIDRGRHPELVTFHEIALPLGPGEETEWGKGDTATVVPFVSLHPQEVSAEYLRGVWRADVIHAAALREWDGIQHWAREYRTHGDGPRQGEAEYAEEPL